MPRNIPSPPDPLLLALDSRVGRRVVVEASGSALTIARILEPHCAEVVIAHAQRVKAISHARVKSDKLDARVLADLLAAELIPQVWVGDERIRALRQLVSRRRGLVKRRTRSRTRSLRCCSAT